jgi:hypothetical protein
MNNDLSIGQTVSFELAMGGRGTGELIGMRYATADVVIYVVKTPKGNEHSFLRSDITAMTPAAPVASKARLADPMTGAVITLEPRDSASPFNFPCCGGLRPAHAGNCRAA